MLTGPGTYDPECTVIREVLEAESIVLIVFNGKRGYGVECQATPVILKMLPNALRGIADAIEHGLKE